MEYCSWKPSELQIKYSSLSRLIIFFLDISKYHWDRIMCSEIHWSLNETNGCDWSHCARDLCHIFTKWKIHIYDFFPLSCTISFFLYCTKETFSASYYFFNQVRDFLRDRRTLMTHWEHLAPKLNSVLKFQPHKHTNKTALHACCCCADAQ